MTSSAPAATRLQHEIEAETAQLHRADQHICAGQARLDGQEVLVQRLRVSGHPNREAERLAGLLRDILTEWQRHRALIALRIAFLERQVRERSRPE
jgi:hypothetical protein